MKVETVRFFKRNEPSTLEELKQTLPVTQDKELFNLASFISTISFECPTGRLVIAGADGYPYVDLDNYTLFILNSTEIEIVKRCHIGIITNQQKVLKFLKHLKTGYPCSYVVLAILIEVLPRLLGTNFRITKEDNLLTIIYR